MNWLRSLIFAALLIQGYGPSNTTASLRGLHNAGRGVIWASGSGGTILRSEDDGFVWQNCSSPADGGKLDFRGIWAWDADRAIAMSSGPGVASRVFGTQDGCASWKLLFTNPDPSGFWDTIAFRDSKRGVILGDPVDGRFAIWNTQDGGEHWARDQNPGLTAMKDEGAFAASNSSLTFVPGTDDLFFGTGGPEGARVFHRTAGEWRSVNTPLGGIFSLQFRDAEHGVAVGGNYNKPAQRNLTAAYTTDGGKTWYSSVTMPGGYRSAVAWDSNSRFWVAAGINGTDVSRDDGKTWTPYQSAGWNTLSLPWAAGSQGRIAVLSSNGT